MSNLPVATNGYRERGISLASAVRAGSSRKYISRVAFFTQRKPFNDYQIARIAFATITTLFGHFYSFF